MKRVALMLLKTTVLFLAGMMLVGLMWFPPTEGRAAGLDLISIYSDPLIIYSFVASIPFFVVLYQVFMLLHLAERNQPDSQVLQKRLQTIVYLSVTQAFLILGAVVFIRFFAQGDDPAGPTMLGLLLMSICGGVASVAETLMRREKKKS